MNTSASIDHSNNSQAPTDKSSLASKDSGVIALAKRLVGESELKSADVLDILKKLERGSLPTESQIRSLEVLNKLGLVEILTSSDREAVNRELDLTRNYIKLSPDIATMVEKLLGERDRIESETNQKAIKRAKIFHRLFSLSSTLEREDREIAFGRSQVSEINSRIALWRALDNELAAKAEIADAAANSRREAKIGDNYFKLTPRGYKILAGLQAEESLIQQLLSAARELAPANGTLDADSTNSELAQIMGCVQTLERFDLSRVITLTFGPGSRTALGLTRGAGVSEPNDIRSSSLPRYPLASVTVSAVTSDLNKRELLQLIRDDGASAAAEAIPLKINSLNDADLDRVIEKVCGALIEEREPREVVSVIDSLVTASRVRLDPICKLSIDLCDAGYWSDSIEVVAALAPTLTDSELIRIAVETGEKLWEIDSDHVRTLLEKLISTRKECVGEVLLRLITADPSSDNVKLDAEMTEIFVGELSQQSLEAIAVEITKRLIDESLFARSEEFFKNIKGSITDKCLADLVIKNVEALLGTDDVDSLVGYPYLSDHVGVLSDAQIEAINLVADNAKNQKQREVLLALHTRISGPALAKSVADLVEAYVSNDELNEAETLLDSVANSVISESRLEIVGNLANVITGGDVDKGLDFIAKAESDYGLIPGILTEKIIAKAIDEQSFDVSSALLSKFAGKLTSETCVKHTLSTVKELYESQETDKALDLWNDIRENIDLQAKLAIGATVTILKFKALVDEEEELDDGLTFIEEQQEVFTAQDFAVFIKDVVELAVIEAQNDSDYDEIGQRILRRFKSSVDADTFRTLADKVLN